MSHPRESSFKEIFGKSGQALVLELFLESTFLNLSIVYSVEIAGEHVFFSAFLSVVNFPECLMQLWFYCVCVQLPQ